MPPAKYTPPVATTFRARLPASLASMQTSKSTVARRKFAGMLRIESCFHDGFGVIFGRCDQLSNFRPFRDVFLIAPEIRKCWERQFPSRHAPLPQVRDEEEDNAADGFDARPWEQNQDARLRNRGLNTVIHPRAERIHLNLCLER